MTTVTTIPADILQIMENKKQQIRQEQAFKAAADKREQDELFAKGSQMYLEARNKSIELLPEWIREYVEPSTLDIDDYIRLARGWGKPDAWLTISIPGLAKILFKTEDETYLSANAWWNGYAEREPELRFDQDSSWRKNLEYTLCEAEKAFRDHQEHRARWEALKEQGLQEYNKRKACDQAAEERRQEQARARAEQQAKEKAEEQALFDAVKNDPILVQLLKAFILIQDERSGFESQLQEADESLYSMENRWSRRAEELRRQADDAQRHADDERSRLQSDLDDAEAKLKKAQRGW